MLDLVEQLYKLRRKRPALFRKSLYTIDRKGSKDDARREKLLGSCVPDPATLQYVNGHKATWEQDPASFWHIYVTTVSCEQQFIVQAMIAGSYVAAMRSDT